MIGKINEVVCDSCSCGIDYLTGTYEDVKRIIQENGCIIKGKLIFCNEECLNKYKEKKNA